jgi:hypothetical protein
VTRRDRDTTREPPWMCVGCGYVMDAASPVDRSHHEPPDEGDLSICLNCAGPYVRERGLWRQMNTADWHGLTPEARDALVDAIQAQSRTIDRDLRKNEKGGRA